MRHWKADLLGLAIGFIIGGAALAWFAPVLGLSAVPDLHAWLLATAFAPPARPPPAAAAPALPTGPVSQGIATPPAPALQTPVMVTHPTPPNVIYPGAGGQHVVTLPTVIRPSVPSTVPDTYTGTAGTGFFIGADATLITAAHVVSGCRHMQVASQRVRPSTARLLGANPEDDIALLRADGVAPPATLALGAPTAATQRLFILGYPQRGGALIPEETWGALANAQLPAFRQPVGDARETVWLHAAAVTHGYSGGPIMDARTGAVVGAVRGLVSPVQLRLMPSMPSDGVAIGPGAAMLARFVHRVVPALDSPIERVVGSDVTDTARRATVHVYCWH